MESVLFYKVNSNYFLLIIYQKTYILVCCVERKEILSSLLTLCVKCKHIENDFKTHNLENRQFENG